MNIRFFTDSALHRKNHSRGNKTGDLLLHMLLRHRPNCGNSGFGGPRREEQLDREMDCVSKRWTPGGREWARQVFDNAISILTRGEVGHSIRCSSRQYGITGTSPMQILKAAEDTQQTISSSPVIVPMVQRDVHRPGRQTSEEAEQESHIWCVEKSFCYRKRRRCGTAVRYYEDHARTLRDTRRPA